VKELDLILENLNELNNTSVADVERAVERQNTRIVLWI